MLSRWQIAFNLFHFRESKRQCAVFRQLSFDVVFQVEEGDRIWWWKEPRTKARTCCVGLEVWGVVKWQACLLLHYSIPCPEICNTDTFSAYLIFSVNGCCITWRDLAGSALVDHSWSKLLLSVNSHGVL